MKSKETNTPKTEELQKRIRELEAENKILREKACFFDELIEHAPFTLFRIDIGQSKYSYNSKFIQLNIPNKFNEVSRDIILEAAQSIHPDDKEEFISNARKFFKEKKARVMKHEYRRYDESKQTYQWTRDILALLSDKNEKAHACLGIALDITPEKILQMQAGQQQKFNRVILESSPNIIYLKDDKGKFILINKTLAHIFGMEPEKLLLSLNSEAELKFGAFFDRHDKRVLSDKSPVTYYEKFISPGNKTYWLYTVKTLVTLDDGTNYILANSADVTASKKAEIKLQLSETRYRNLMDSLNSPMIILNGSLEILLVNKTGLEFFEIDKETYIGKHYSEIFRPYLNLNDQILEEVIFTGESKYFEAKKIELDREDKWFLQTIEPLKDIEGENIGVQILLFDVTKLKQNEIKLRESEIILRGIINATTDHIFLLNNHLKIVTANESVLEYFGETIEGIKGKSANDIFSFEESQTKESLAMAVIETKEIKRMVENINEMYFEITMYPILNEQGNVSSFVVIVRNITMLKNAEIETKKALEKEQILNNLKSSVISTASHEFRTPLSIINSNIQILEKYHKKLTDSDYEKKISLISQSLQHLDQLLNSISMLDKSDKGPMTFSPKSIHFENLLYQIVEELESIDSKRKRIQLNIHSKLGYVNMDELLIRYIVSNLLTNALKYSSIEKEVFVVSKQPDQTNVEITVIDEGIGIKPGEIENISEPFFRGTNVRNIKGTGVGFTILKYCVQLHHGTIGIESKLDEGTKVRVVLPFTAIP